jgi:putative transcriptional regulator
MKNTIRVERAKKRITQKQLAVDVETSRQTIHLIETEKSEPKLSLAIKIARYFERKVEEIWEL